MESFFDYGGSLKFVEFVVVFLKKWGVSLMVFEVIVKLMLVEMVLFMEDYKNVKFEFEVEVVKYDFFEFKWVLKKNIVVGKKNIFFIGVIGFFGVYLF